MPRREVPCVLVGHKVTEVQESLEDLQLSADAFFIYTFFRQFSCFLFLVEELVINIWPWWQETQMILNAMNVGTSISQRVSGQTVSRDSLGIALNLYRRSLTFDVCSVVMCRDVLCPSNEHSIVTVSEGEGVLIRLNGSLPHSKKSWWHLVLHRICRLLFALSASGCLLRRKKRTEMAQALITTLSVHISAQICGTGYLECFISHVSIRFRHVSPLLLHHGTLFWHRICACSHFAASSQRKLTKHAGCQLPSHPVAASSLSKMLWELLLTWKNLRTLVNFHFWWRFRCPLWAKIFRIRAFPDGVRVWARSHQVRLLDAGT